MKLAKLQTHGLWSKTIWESLVRYVNGTDAHASRSQVRDFIAVLNLCMNWIGGELEDIEEYRNAKGDHRALNDLASRHRPEIRRVLVWLSAPEQRLEFAAGSIQFLGKHVGSLRMEITENPSFKAGGDDPILLMWPETFISAATPVCKFILDQIERHDTYGEMLSKIVPIGLCARSGCGRLFMIERVGRARFCSSTCRSGAYQKGLTREQKAERTRSYRARLKEMRNKPIRFPKRKSTR